ncbi:Helicase associated domain protein [Streptomyces sp. 900105755]
MTVTPRPHQAEAVDAALRQLCEQPGRGIPPEGLRTQVIAATGSGKTPIGVTAADRPSARRVLVLVPTPDLLLQTAAVRQAGGRRGAMIGVCSLRGADSQGVPCTTDPDELIAWTAGDEAVTVFATYASVGVGTLQRAHAAGLPVWDLMVVDEAHRVSGDAGKPWAAVHDQAQVPAVRRLYMTATARVWEAGGGERPRLVASMDEDSPVFGPVAYTPKPSEAIRLGVWVADQRRYYTAGTLEASRVGELEALGMVWPVQASAWEAGLTAARQFHARERHLQVPRKAVEIVDGEEYKLGAWLDNTRRRAAKLSPQRRTALDALGMRW